MDVIDHCRTCFTPCYDNNSYLFKSIDTTVIQVLTECFHLQGETISVSSIICNECTTFIEQFCTFQTRCVQVAELFEMKHMSYDNRSDNEQQELLIEPYFSNDCQQEQALNKPPYYKDEQKEEEEEEEEEEKQPLMDVYLDHEDDEHKTVIKAYESDKKPKKKFECHLCEKSYSLYSLLAWHMKITHLVKPHFDCDKCQAQFYCSSELQTHKLYQHTPTCPTCGKPKQQFKAFRSHLRHCKIHYVNNCLDVKQKKSKHKRIVCEVCGKNVFDIKIHRQTHEPNDRKFKCRACGERFQTFQLVREHRAKTHDGSTLPRNLQCDICDKKFSKGNVLSAHKRRMHIIPFNLACTICAKLFKVPSELERHMRYHTKEKPVACHVCDKRFYSYSQMKRHMLSHTGEKPFTCALCDKAFSRKELLNAHIKAHCDMS